MGKALGPCAAIKTMFGEGLSLSITLDVRRIRDEGREQAAVRDALVDYVMKLAPDAELLTEGAGSLRFRIPQPKTMGGGGGGGGGASGSEVALDAPPASSVSLSS